MEELVTPNTFLIGVQKAATTSVYSWLSQHPDICAPMSVKDYAFFTRDDFFNKGLEHLSSFYQFDHGNEKVVLQGSVHYIFFEKALKRIKDFNPNAKFILVLRNPVERAFSAYQYAVKFNYENLEISTAFAIENERLISNDHRVVSELTYKHHGLYFKQIQTFLKYFKNEQLKVILYEDVSNPDTVTKELFEFLQVDTLFQPDFKPMNITGTVKNKMFQKLFLGDYKLKKWFINNVVDKVLSQEFKSNLRWKIIHLNTKKKNTNDQSELDEELKLELINFFEDDIKQLEQFLSVDLSHWRQ